MRRYIWDYVALTSQVPAFSEPKRPSHPRVAFSSWHFSRAIGMFVFTNTHTTQLMQRERKKERKDGGGQHHITASHISTYVNVKEDADVQGKRGRHFRGPAPVRLELPAGDYDDMPFLPSQCCHSRTRGHTYIPAGACLLTSSSTLLNSSPSPSPFMTSLSSLPRFSIAARNTLSPTFTTPPETTELSGSALQPHSSP